VLQAHAAAWGQRWLASDLEIEGDEVAQRAVRFAVYHLNSAANPEDPHVSISARGLTGEAYLGHVFWDTEIFLLPFYSLTWPEAARALLRYRSHTLAGARAKAARLGYRGALYAWESADTGEEATPEYAYGPDGHLIPIRCGSQEQHISADVAYAVWQYWLATEDVPFLLEAGAEILLETARFWASRATLEDDGQYHLRGVIGPDEYHEQVDDNAFTNVMAAWNLERGLAVADLLRTRWPEHWLALKERLGLAEAELRQWPTVAAGLCVPMDARSGVLEQFAGYFGLDQIDLMQFEPRRVPMDVVLGPERTRTSQVLKQADVVMLLALLPERFAPAIQATNFGYYEPRCGHGSSLSRSVHALVAARVGQMDLAMRYFREAAVIDLEDTTRTGGGGVHMAALGGLWQAVVLGFAGLRLQPEGISLDPVLPPSWESLAFRVQWRGRRLRVHIAGGAPAQVTVRLEHGAPVPIAIGGTLELLEGERTWTATSSNHSVRPRDCVANGTAAGVGSRRPGGDN
jgi:trehalose/maltose hydrolase-like predicted phosphorylase